MTAPHMIPEWIEQLGWVLIHFTWQGALIGAFAWLILALLRKSSANPRYWVLCGALVCCAVAPCLTWVSLQKGAQLPITSSTRPKNELVTQPKLTVPETTIIAATVAVQEIAISPKWTLERLIGSIHRCLPICVAFWCLGVILLSLRLLHGWLELRKLCASGMPLKDQNWVARFDQLADRMGIRHTILLLESVLVEVPTVIGWLRPMVLLPVTFFTGLSPDQIEAILVHELAHIRRHDYLVNLIQIGIETLLFYHPVVWWISRSIREERENCCDDLALQIVGDKLVYASALASLEESRSLPMAITLAATGGSLLQRIKRLLGASEGKPFPWLLFLLLIVALGVGAFALKDSIWTKKMPLAKEGTTVIQSDSSSPKKLTTDRIAELTKDASTNKQESFLVEIIGMGQATLTPKNHYEGTIRLTQNFPYATDFNPPELYHSQAKSNEVIAVPSTPKAFQADKLGWNIHLKAKREGAVIALNGVVEYTSFKTFVPGGYGAFSGPVYDNSGKHLLTSNTMNAPVIDKTEPRFFLSAIPSQKYEVPFYQGTNVIKHFVAVSEIQEPAATNQTKASDSSATTNTVAGVNPVAQKVQEASTIQLHIQDDRGGPLSGASVQAEWPDHSTNLITDSDGMAAITTDARPANLIAHVQKEGFVPKIIFWTLDEPSFQLPHDFTLKMEKAQSIGGIVVNEQGKPVEGAKVVLIIRGSNMGGGQESVYNDIYEERATTDQEGKWHYDKAPSDLSSLSVTLEHPDYISNEKIDKLPPAEDFKKWSAHLIARKGNPVEGIVTDEQGKPLSGIDVTYGEAGSESPSYPTTQTDAKGHFRFGGLPEKLSYISPILTFTSKDYAPEMLELGTLTLGKSLNVVMKQGKRLTVRFIDKQGNPVPKVTMAPDYWKGHRPFRCLQINSDTNGNAIWEHAPEATITYSIWKDGFQPIDTTFTTKDSVQTFQINHPSVVTGHVLDAVTKKPITDYQLIPGRYFPNNHEWDSWERESAKHIQADSFDYTFTRATQTQGSDGKPPTDGSHRIRIDVPGYESGVSRPIANDEEAVSLDFELKPTPSVSGTVKSADGSPASGAKLIIMSHEVGQMVILNGDYKDFRNLTTIHTDEHGKYELPAEDEDYPIVIFQPDAGYFTTTYQKLKSAPNVQLLPWGQIHLSSADPSGIIPKTGDIRVESPKILFDCDAPNKQVGGSLLYRHLARGPIWLGVRTGDHKKGTLLYTGTVVKVEGGKTTEVDLKTVNLEKVVGGKGPPVDLINKFLSMSGVPTIPVQTNGVTATNNPPIQSASPIAQIKFIAKILWINLPLGKPADPALAFLDSVTNTNAPPIILSEAEMNASMKVLNHRKDVDSLLPPAVTTGVGVKGSVRLMNGFTHPTEWDRVEKGWKGKNFKKAEVGISIEMLGNIIPDGSFDMQFVAKDVEYNGYRDLDAPNGIETNDKLSPMFLDSPDTKIIDIQPNGHRLKPDFTEYTRSMQVRTKLRQTVVFLMPGVQPRNADSGKNEAEKYLIAFVTAEEVMPSAKPTSVGTNR